MICFLDTPDEFAQLDPEPLGFNDSWIDSCYRNKHDEFVDEVDENLLQML
jgi:hypothetical protein